MFPNDVFVLLHNPNCSKSRAAKALLEEQGCVFEERQYLQQPLDALEVMGLVAALGSPDPEVWLRLDASGAQQRGVRLDGPLDDLVDAVVAEPALLQRPVLVRGNVAAVGRPLEQIATMLTEFADGS